MPTQRRPPRMVALRPPFDRICAIGDAGQGVAAGPASAIFPISATVAGVRARAEAWTSMRTDLPGCRVGPSPRRTPAACRATPSAKGLVVFPAARLRGRTTRKGSVVLPALCLRGLPAGIPAYVFGHKQPLQRKTAQRKATGKTRFKLISDVSAFGGWAFAPRNGDAKRSPPTSVLQNRNCAGCPWIGWNFPRPRTPWQ